MTIRNSLVVLALMVFGSSAIAHSHSEPGEQETGGLSMKTLASGKLARVEDTEYVVSRVVIPPDTKMPLHWHPGEEFAFVIRGEVTVLFQGQAPQVFREGEVGKVPLKQVHTAQTGELGADLLVFRVHEQGEPERVLVE